ncbi:hypothetical protein P4131_34330 [Pseudomonas aeruginosa]|nr:hypothetical protein [Pseudomonas aeruginosa]
MIGPGEARPPLPRHADLAFPHRLRLSAPRQGPAGAQRAARGRRRPQSATPGRSLSPRLLPWYQDGQPILWWSPDPRTVLFPDELHRFPQPGQVPAPATLRSHFQP